MTVEAQPNNSLHRGCRINGNFAMSGLGLIRVGIGPVASMLPIDGSVGEKFPSLGQCRVKQFSL